MMMVKVHPRRPLGAFLCLHLLHDCQKLALPHAKFRASLMPLLTLAVIKVSRLSLGDKARGKYTPRLDPRLPCLPNQIEFPLESAGQARKEVPSRLLQKLLFLAPIFVSRWGPTVCELLKESIIIMKLRPAMRAGAPQERRGVESVPAFPDGSEMLGLELACEGGGGGW